MRKKMLLVLESLEMGGISRVSCVLGDQLQETHDVTIYSTLSQRSYYQTKASIHFAKKRQRVDTLVKKALAKAKFLFFNRETNPTRTNKVEVSTLLDFIYTERPHTIILTARFMSYAKTIKQNFPQIRVIGWAHNSAAIYLEHYYLSIQKYFLSSVQCLDTLVVLTDRDKEIFSTYTKNVVCIYNPLTLVNKTGISNLENQTICFVGRIDFSHKGIDYLIQVARKLPDYWKIKLAGTGSKKELKKMYQLQKNYCLADKLIIEGPKNDAELQSHYYDSSIYIMTSRWEGMPLVLAEAMSFGLPILAFEQTGSQEVLENGKYGVLVKNGDVDELVRKLLDFTNNREKRSAYQQLSLERTKDFSIEHIVKQWLAIGV